MNTTPVRVTLPLPASVRNPRTGAERCGFAWFERVVDVPDLESEARVNVPMTNLKGEGSPNSFRGACAGGGHWRRLGEKAITGGALVPFVLGTGLDRRSGAVATTVVRRSAGRTRSLGRSPRVQETRALAVAADVRHGHDQHNLYRFHGVRGRKVFVPEPFALKPGHEATLLDPAFEAHLMDRACTELAIVDGEPMLRADPPSVVVVVQPSLRVDVRVRYADFVDAPLGSAVALCPHESLDDIIRSIDAEIGRPAASPSWTVGWRDDGVDGRVATPTPSELISVHDPVSARRHAMDQHRFERLGAWFEREVSPTLVPAPPDLDALGFPDHDTATPGFAP